MNKSLRAVSLGKVLGCYLLVAVFAIGLTATFAIAAKDCSTLVCNDNQVLICHNPDNYTVSEPEEVPDQVLGKCMCVANEAIDTHLGHGDYLGECVSSPTN